MSQTRYKLDPDVRRMCISLVRRYDDYKADLRRERERILHGASLRRGGPRSTRGGDPTAGKAMRLAELDNSFRARAVCAVDSAMLRVGDDLTNEDDITALRGEIRLSCFERLAFTATKSSRLMSENKFYEYKRYFLWLIAQDLYL